MTFCRMPRVLDPGERPGVNFVVSDIRVDRVDPLGHPEQNADIERSTADRCCSIAMPCRSTGESLCVVTKGT